MKAVYPFSDILLVLACGIADNLPNKQNFLTIAWRPWPSYSVIMFMITDPLHVSICHLATYDNHAEH